MYHSCCGGHAINLSLDDAPKAYQDYIDKLIDRIFKAQAAPDADPTLIRTYGNKLESGIIKGFGKTLADVDFTTPDSKTLVSLQNNVWQFSAAKTYTQMKDMSAALVDANGKVRSFEEFRREAQQITGEQLRWLKTEYDTAIGSGQAAAQWLQIQAEKDTFPFLEYDAVLDDRTSQICIHLDGIIKAVDDPFWDTYYIPNHFGERSVIRRLREGKVTPDDEIVHPEKMAAIFKNNVGKNGWAFSPDSNYFVDAPPHVVKNATLYMPENDQYVIRYKGEAGVELSVNRKTLIENKPDLPDIEKAGKALVDKGRSVDILPEIHAKETDLRKALLPDVANGKNPDILLDRADYADVKKPQTPANYKTLMRNVAGAAQQADRIIVLLEQEYERALLKQVAEQRFKDFPDILEIGFVTADGEYIEFHRPKK
ncbi:phage minor head protein [Mucilaginibacter sp.]|uniref:phage minor head protein n=1 Tax=Mucilaginibacter sp. TaxID=1882438 RepID=UPI00326784E3